MKFLVPNYSCLQNPMTKGLPPPDPRPLCPQLNLLNPPPKKKIPGYATDCIACDMLHTSYVLSGSVLDHNVNWRIRLSGRLLSNIVPSCPTNRQLTLHQNQIYTFYKTGITSGYLITCVGL